MGIDHWIKSKSNKISFNLIFSLQKISQPVKYDTIGIPERNFLRRSRNTRNIMTETSPIFPDLETDRLILRQLTMDDDDFMFKQFSDPQVTQYLMDEPPVKNIEEARMIIQYFLEPEGKNRNRWGIIRKSDNQIIGTCGFHRWEKAYFRSEIGYDLYPDFWGQGYMTEALRAAINNGFERMKLNRIDALVYIDNPRSSGLLKKLGFKQEGILRDYFYLNGTFYDHEIFSLLKRDWQSGRGNE
jgi:ribosomal-protein-alanine N-acetyltransferase